MPNQWTFILESTAGTQLADLIDAHDTTVTFRLTDKTEAGFSLSGFSPRAPLITELATDLLVVCNNQTMTRLRIGGSTETLDGTNDELTVSAVDYRGVLERRYVQTARTWTATDMAQIGWDLINTTQTTGIAGDFGIRRGTVTTVGNVTYTAPAGKRIAGSDSALDDLTGMWPGMNWWIDGDLRYQAVGFRGIQRNDFLLEYGTNVTDVRREVDTGDYANSVRQSGADGVPTAVANATDLATRPERRIEAQEGNTDLATAANVTDAARQFLVDHGTLLPAYTLTLTPGVWTPDALWLGDFARIRINAGRLAVDSIERVFEITVRIDDDGGETVELGFGSLRQDLLRLLRTMPQRIEAINRR